MGAPYTHMRLSGSEEVETYIPFWAKEKRVRGWSLKGEEDSSQEDAKNKCLPCYADKSFWYKKLFLAIALSLLQGPYLNFFRQLRER